MPDAKQDVVKALSDDEVARIQKQNQYDGGLIISPEIDALCATVRALRAEVADYEQTDLIPRSRYEAADADREEARQQFRDIAKKAAVEIERLESANTALREQLAQRDFRIKTLKQDLEQVRKNNARFQSELAQVTQERDELRSRQMLTREDGERFIRQYQHAAQWEGEQLMITFENEALIAALIGDVEP